MLPLACIAAARAYRRVESIDRRRTCAMADSPITSSSTREEI